MTDTTKAVIIGSGPNGLTAGILLAKKGIEVTIYEAKDTPGGGMRTKELIFPGYYHDVCASVFPMTVNSPVINTFPLEKYGLEWIFPEYSLVHLLTKGKGVFLKRNIEETAAQFGSSGEKYKKLTGGLVKDFISIQPDILGGPVIPRRIFKAANFGKYAALSSEKFSGLFLEGEEMKALFAGISSHVPVPQDGLFSSGPGLALLLSAHTTGWPVAKGGAGAITEALTGYFKDLGGKMVTGTEITSLEQISNSGLVFFDITPKQILKIAGEKLHTSYRRKLEKYRYGPSVYKIDFILNEPVPFGSGVPQNAAAFHIGGSASQIFSSVNDVYNGNFSDEPFIILNQPSLYDATRAPGGKHILWAYAHVPFRSEQNYTDTIFNRIEEFAPGFRDIIDNYCVTSPLELEKYNPNYIGGDIMGGTQDTAQFFSRPVLSLNPYKLPVPGMYICSSATPPGGGVHGMCGYNAFEAAKKDFNF